MTDSCSARGCCAEGVLWLKSLLGLGRGERSAEDLFNFNKQSWLGSAFRSVRSQNPKAATSHECGQGCLERSNAISVHPVILKRCLLGKLCEACVLLSDGGASTIPRRLVRNGARERQLVLTESRSMNVRWGGRQNGARVATSDLRSSPASPRLGSAYSNIGTCARWPETTRP